MSLVLTWGIFYFQWMVFFSSVPMEKKSITGLTYIYVRFAHICLCWHLRYLHAVRLSIPVPGKGGSLILCFLLLLTWAFAHLDL